MVLMFSGVESVGGLVIILELTGAYSRLWLGAGTGSMGQTAGTRKAEVAWGDGDRVGLASSLTSPTVRDEPHNHITTEHNLDIVLEYLG